MSSKTFSIHLFQRYKKPKYSEEGIKLYETIKQKKEKYFKAIQRSLHRRPKGFSNLGGECNGLLDSDQED